MQTAGTEWTLYPLIYADGWKGKAMNKYRDTETGAILTGAELYRAYIANEEEIAENSGASSFREWLRNCTSKNGFLEAVTDE